MTRPPTAQPPTWSHFEPRYRELETRTLTPQNVEAWLSEWSDLEKELNEQHAILSRAKNEDTRDKGAEAAYVAFVSDVFPQLESVSQRFKNKLLGLEGYEPNAEHTEFVRRFRNEAELFREANVSLLTEELTLSSEYNTLMGALTVTLDGETITLPAAQKKLLEPDRALRERAWRAVAKAKESVSDELDTLFLKLFKLRWQLAQNAGLSDFRAYSWRRMNRFDYTPEDSLAFHDSIASEAVPLIVKVREERREEMGLSALRPWDLAVDPQARAPLAPFETAAELEEGLTRIFEQLDSELAAQFSSLRNGWLELEAREGKVPGLGYQDFFPRHSMPYIYWSVTGTHADITVLVHEAGHAFHSLASVARNDLIMNFYPGMEFAEVASQAMELLTLPYLSRDKGGFYSEEDAARAQRESLERVLHQLPSQAQSDAFQHWLYTETPEDVSIEQLDAKWTELSGRFSPGVDWTGLERERTKGWHYFHIFAVPFYMLEYSYAWLGAIRIWQNALQDPRDALAKYRAALSLGGARPLSELFEAAGSRFAFDQKTVGELMRFVYERR